MLEDLGADDPVKGPVRERQVKRITLDGADPNTSGVDLTGLLHRTEGGSNVGHLICPCVEGDDRCSSAGELIGMATKATAEIEDLVAGLDAKRVVVGSEHQSNSTAEGRGSPERTAS